MTCFSSHFSCTPNLSNVFEMNTSGQHNFCESLFLEESFNERYKCWGRERVNCLNIAWMIVIMITNRDVYRTLSLLTALDTSLQTWSHFTGLQRLWLWLKLKKSNSLSFGFPLFIRNVREKLSVCVKTYMSSSLSCFCLFVSAFSKSQSRRVDFMCWWGRLIF